MTPASRRRYGPILSILVPPALNIHITRLPGIKYAGQMNINPRWQVNRVDMHEFLCRPGEIFRRRLGYQGREGGGKSGFSQFFFPDNQWIFSWYNCAKIEGKIKSLPLFTKMRLWGRNFRGGEKQNGKRKVFIFSWKYIDRVVLPVMEGEIVLNWIFLSRRFVATNFFDNSEIYLY